ncbi:UDP-2,4-diacetamido-2,4,6-trideoxy-beta-L-altropyranose hydrolase [Planktomarina temperata]|nr:UDP-2,4-diacetamido-2,4,6-trideoxy-beta-L-altropyranose hydrolase [Planktomarina temperata]
MRVVFRTDASTCIGTGHVMRCLTLAEGLSFYGCTVQFICRPHKGNLINYIRNKGFEVLELPVIDRLEGEAHISLKHILGYETWLECPWELDASQSASLFDEKVDWLVIDHYGMDQRWSSVLQDKTNYIMCIDDLANRKLLCDIILDQTTEQSSRAYAKLVPKHTNQLLGPQYALLRPEFAQWREFSLSRRTHPSLQNILITMGGVDNENITSRVLLALESCTLKNNLEVNVVLGVNAPWENQVRRLASLLEMPVNVLSGVSNIAELMSISDLVIGAGGSTTWERCSLGVPSILLVTADNQMRVADKMDFENAAYVIYDTENLERNLKKFLNGEDLLEKLTRYSSRGSKIVGADGVNKVVHELIAYE